MKLWEKLEFQLASLKGAILLIIAFSLFMSAGTICESLYGREFANRIIFKSPIFLFLQLLLFLSILWATLRRLPFQKKLTGFYCTHLGLLLIFSGAFITYIAGIDGQIFLNPQIKENKVYLEDDVIYWQNEKEALQGTFSLPESFYAQKIDKNFGPVKILKYLPYGEEVLQWKKSQNPFLSSEFLLENSFLKQKFALSLNPESSIKSKSELGPLIVQMLPHSLFPCFHLGAFLLKSDSSCIPLTSLQVIEEKNREISVNFEGKKVTFAPHLSIHPIDSSRTDIKLFNPDLFLDKKIVFLFKDGLAFPFENQMKTLPFRSNESIELPWMNFKIKRLKSTLNEFPLHVPVPGLPKSKKGELVKGKTRAVLLQKKNGEEFWLRSGESQTIETQNGHALLALGKKSFNLPYFFFLDRFESKKYPGTNDASTYESFINISNEQGLQEKAHIYMNSPLSKDGLTFYQSSYFDSSPNEKGSILSVNYDPGRKIKYFGSLILVLGIMIHYLIKTNFLRLRFLN